MACQMIRCQSANSSQALAHVANTRQYPIGLLFESRRMLPVATHVATAMRSSRQLRHRVNGMEIEQCAMNDERHQRTTCIVSLLRHCCSPKQYIYRQIANLYYGWRLIISQVYSHRKLVSDVLAV